MHLCCCLVVITSLRLRIHHFKPNQLQRAILSKLCKDFRKILRRCMQVTCPFSELMWHQSTRCRRSSSVGGYYMPQKEHKKEKQGTPATIFFCVADACGLLSCWGNQLVTSTTCKLVSREALPLRWRRHLRSSCHLFQMLTRRIVRTLNSLAAAQFQNGCSSRDVLSF